MYLCRLLSQGPVRDNVGSIVCFLTYHNLFVMIVVSCGSLMVPLVLQLFSNRRKFNISNPIKGDSKSFWFLVSIDRSIHIPLFSVITDIRRNILQLLGWYFRQLLLLGILSFYLYCYVEQIEWTMHHVIRRCWN